MKRSVKNILAKINKRRSISMAAILISLSYLLSRILGLVRDRLLASNFGLSPQADAYAAAFRIPDLLFTLLVSGAFAVSFIPVFVGYLEKKKIDEAWEIASVVLNLLVLLTLALGIVTFIFTEPLVRIIAPGFDAERFTLTVNLTRIMLLTPLFFVISSVLGAIQQAFQRFILFALASVFYNVGIIIGILYFEPFFQVPIYGVAWGVVAGTALQAVIQLWGVWGLGFKYNQHFKIWHPSIGRIVKLMVPRSLDLGLEQINTIVETAIGSQLAAGSLTSFYFANNLKNVPLGLFGGAIATAIFPSLIRAAHSKDKSKLPMQVVHTVQLVLFLVIPAAAVAIIMRGYIVRLLLGFGDQTTADALGWFAGVIVAQSVFFVIARVFYALEDTRTPLITSLITLVLNIIFSYIFAREFGVPGLAMALSFVTTIELIMLMLFLRVKIGNYGLKGIVRTAFRIFIAATVMMGSMYIAITTAFPLRAGDLGWRILAPKFFIVCALGLVVYMVGCWVLRVRELDMILRLAKARYRKQISRRIGA
ncbi:murein biosynthesis integral membrane protein MurJ [Candidatus Saccharibacteria bacterium]|nr:murein biosynthesis integral membrane protein MurJ [Candidatus Saccharibacteria bacterium]